MIVYSDLLHYENAGQIKRQSASQHHQAIAYCRIHLCMTVLCHETLSTALVVTRCFCSTNKVDNTSSFCRYCCRGALKIKRWALLNFSNKAIITRIWLIFISHWWEPSLPGDALGLCTHNLSCTLSYPLTMSTSSLLWNQTEHHMLKVTYSTTLYSYDYQTRKIGWTFSVCLGGTCILMKGFLKCLIQTNASLNV